LKEKLQTFFRSNGKTDQETNTLNSVQAVCDKVSMILAVIFFIGTLLCYVLTVNAEETAEYIFTTSHSETSVGSDVTVVYSRKLSSANDFEVIRVDCIEYGFSSSYFYTVFKNPTITEPCLTEVRYIDGSESSVYTFSTSSMAKYTVNDDEYYFCPVISFFNEYEGFKIVNTWSNVDYEYSYGEYSSAMHGDIYAKYLNGELTYVNSNSTYTYNSALDFTHISAEYNLKYTIKKDLTGAWNFITPSEAGIQFHWTNNQNIDNAYLKFDIYGTFYDSMWATSGTYTHVTVDGVSKSDCAYLLKQSNLVELARQALGADSGHGLDINYIYVQAYGNIDGALARSRIYKFNNELISDYGNASSEYDEYVPEITSGISLPTDYELDDALIDPEATEPSADTTSTTVITTPVDDLDYTSYYDEQSLLKALTKFYDMLKSMVLTLGQFPTLFANVFSFLPNEITVLICGSLLLCIFLRFIGR